MTETARAWGDMSPEEKVAWLRDRADYHDMMSEADLDCLTDETRDTDYGRQVVKIAGTNANTAAALTDLADRIERDERRRETARYYLTRGDAP